MSDQYLVRIDRATQSLAACNSIKELKAHADLAAAAKVWYRRTKASAKHRNYATAFELRCERRLGEILAQSEKNKGTAGAGRPQKGGAKREPPKTPTLSDIGVSKRESSHAQKLAKINGNHFDKVVGQLESAEEAEIPKAKAVEALHKDEPEWVKLAKENERKPFPWRHESAFTELISNVDKLRVLPIGKLALYLRETPTGRKHIREKHLDAAILFLQELSVQLKERL